MKKISNVIFIISICIIWFFGGYVSYKPINSFMYSPNENNEIDLTMHFVVLQITDRSCGEPNSQISHSEIVGYNINATIYVYSDDCVINLIAILHTFENITYQNGIDYLVKVNNTKNADIWFVPSIGYNMIYEMDNYNYIEYFNY